MGITMGATLSDISSNARVKDYPSLTVLQVANAAIFRQPGYEPRKRPFDVPPKGEAEDPERSQASSRARARAAVRDIALCNHFTYFFTWTLNKELIDRYDAAQVGKKVRTFLKNVSYRKGFSYVLVPELHKDGAIHFHGLCNLGDVAVEQAYDPHTGKPLTTKDGRPILNMTDWKWGFSSCVPIDGNYERTCNYVTKYISKGTDKILGKWYYSSRDLVKRPDISIIDGGMDYFGFLQENPETPVVPVYRDICIAVMQQLREPPIEALEGGCL